MIRSAAPQQGLLVRPGSGYAAGVNHLGATALALITLLLACDKGSNAEPAPPKPPMPVLAAPSAPRASASAAVPAPAPDPLTRVPAPARLVAIGDLHGDLTATRAALRIAGAVDEKDHWTGGALVIVQTGDQLDRGDGERAILDLFDRLADEAKAAGGAVISLNGNHEVMNVQLDFRYVTDAGFHDFNAVPGTNLADPRLAKVAEPARERAASFLPGAPYAKRLARRDTIALVGDTLFVHGGILPKHVKYGLPRINREIKSWMNGERPSAPEIAIAEDGPIWTRRYSAAPDVEDCKVLGEALSAASAKRMVVGHTPQRGGITSACDDRVWRIDVGLAHFYGGDPEVLEIVGDTVKKLKKKP
jgi:calcineurin-like phosphoesterase family protein